MKKESHNKILVVDDDLVITRIASITLQPLGYDVTIASNGKDGIEEARQNRPDLILLDANMPEMTGFEMLEQMRQDPELRDIKVIMLSGNTEADDISEACSYNILDYVTKPFDPSELREKIEAALTAKS